MLEWVFQEGHLEGLLGFESMGGITAWLPMFLFVVLFGLSMDYHVFILSRIREAHDQGLSTSDAIEAGLRRTAGPVTSAAIVMVAVFSIFATLSMLEFKQMGGERMCERVKAPALLMHLSCATIESRLKEIGGRWRELPDEKSIYKFAFTPEEEAELVSRLGY